MELQKFVFCVIGMLALGVNTLAQQRVIIIGDAGKLKNGKNAVVEAVKNSVSVDEANTSILFLGDNIYPKGLPDEEDKNYEVSAHVLKSILTPFAGYKAGIYVVPGNHDWQKGGPDGWENVKRQQQFVESLGQSNTIFLPKGGCPGPEEVLLGDNIVMIIMDTQWWLNKNDKPGISSDCECKTEEEVIARLRDIVHRHEGKKFLFASHHGLRSYGIHAGYYTLKQHIFPLTDFSEKAYVPLPGIGSLYPIVRGKFGNIEDLMHPVYKDMIRSIEGALGQARDLTYVAGHDHNLQMITDASRSYVISGSGTNRDRVKKGKKSLFASDKNGYAEIIYDTNGETINFYEVDENSKTKLVFTYHPEKITPLKKNTEADVKLLTDDSITVRIAPEYDAVSAGHRRIWGEHYRKLWATPVTMKVFHINKERGGLNVLQKGGGQQTKSLRLEDKDGKQWVLRTIQKNPEKALPANLRSTIAKTIVQDQTAAANPYAPVAIPILATAAKVPHSNPQIVYVPDDPALGVYQQEFANSVCVFEEREPGADETYSTPKVLEKLEDDNGNSVNQEAVLRARMLDLLIGDWDRHEDQWRWIREKKGTKHIYSPVPRDRDQAFYINTGIVPHIARLKWIMPKFQGFGNEVRDVNGFMFNARYFDRMFLNQLNEKEWQTIIASIQSSLTDEIITSAIQQLPDTIYQQVGKTIIEGLRSRRNNLMTYGMTYYKFLSKSIEIASSDKKDNITISTAADGNATVLIQKSKKDGTPGDSLYFRNIDRHITDEVRIFARGGDDHFFVTGDHKPGFKIRLIGGGGEDVYEMQGKGRVLIYDRSDKKNKYPDHGARLLTSDNNAVNEYDPRTFNYNKLAPIVTAGYNLDDGLFLGAGALYTKYGFRRQPFAARHRLIVGHALATDASFIRYKGDVTNIIGKGGLDMYLNINAPDNTANFFGVGNETPYLEITNPSIRYYRTRYNFIDGQVKFRFPVAKSFNLFAGPAVQYYKMDVDDNIDRFINIYQLQQNDPTLFSHKTFAGGVGGFELDTRNQEIEPVRGFYWRTTYTAMQQLDEKDSYGQLRSEMRMYLSFARYPKLVIANRVGGGVSAGNPEFFQMFYLGGNAGLQGYRNNRYAGEGLFYNNLELRLKLFDFTSYLFPGKVGLVAFNDVGRIFAKNEESGKWHWGYGGGFYVIPAESIVITATAGFSEEGALPYIGLGFRY